MSAPNNSSQCLAGKKWTLEEEAEDLAREVETLQSGGVWIRDISTDVPFLGYLSSENKAALIAHLRAGKLRDALGLVAMASYNFGLKNAPIVWSDQKKNTPAVRRKKEVFDAIILDAWRKKLMRAAVERLLKAKGASQYEVNHRLGLWPWRGNGRPRKLPRE